MSPELEEGQLQGVRVSIVYDCLFPWTAGGAERWYRALADRLVLEGAEVRYLTRLQWDASDRPEIAGVEVIPVLGAVELYEADGTRKIGPPLRFGFGVLRWCVRHRHEVDVVHLANFPFFALLAAKLALLGTPAVITVDWLEVWPLGFWRSYAGALAGTVGSMIQRCCIACTDTALVFARVNADRLLARGFRGAPTVLAGLLPEVDEAPQAEGRRLTPSVLFVGRLVKDKGLRLLPDAMLAARELVPDLRLTIVGTGPEHELIEGEFGRRGLSEVVDFLGHVSDEALVGLRASATCTVIASIREGYGLSAVESISVGTPVVVAAHPENLAVHLVEEGVNGFVVEPSSAGLADGIARASDAGAALRRSTRNWYLEHAPAMSIDRSLDQVVRLYSAHLASRSIK